MKRSSIFYSLCGERLLEFRLKRGRRPRESGGGRSSFYGKAGGAARLWVVLAMQGLLSVAAFAQPAPEAPRPAVASVASVDVSQALAVALQWVTLSDAGQGVAMWEQAAPLMKAGSDQAFWVSYVATMRKVLGNPAGEKSWALIVREVDRVSLPPGEYVSVVFDSPFSNTRAWEKVSLLKDRERNQWVPVGYQYGIVQPTPKK